MVANRRESRRGLSRRRSRVRVPSLPLSKCLKKASSCCLCRREGAVEVDRLLPATGNRSLGHRRGATSARERHGAEVVTGLGQSSITVVAASSVGFSAAVSAENKTQLNDRPSCAQGEQPTRSRIWLMSRCSSIRSRVHCVSNSSCFPRTFYAGIGMKYELTRRPSTISLVMPVWPDAQCRAGSRNGAFRIGFSMTASDMAIGVRSA